MTQKQLEYILDSDLSTKQKADMIMNLYQEPIEIHREGGEFKKLNPEVTITVGGLEFDVEIAETEEKRQEGLSNCNKLAEDEGMLFIHEETTDGFYTMKDTSIDLDIIFIDEDGIVMQVNSVKANSEEPVECKGFKYVLEVNINSGVRVGDELEEDPEEFTEEEKEIASKSKMLVLDSNGDVQMKLEGGERIVSMIKTRQLIKAILKAYKYDTDAYYKKVGKLIFKEFDAQDSRTPEYIEKPSND